MASSWRESDEKAKSMTPPPQPAAPTGATAYDFSARTLAGGDVELASFRGKVALIVNVASRCGFTPQYTGLEALYRKFKDQGFVVLGFPCNQFGKQEPGTEAEIQAFCETKFEVSFPMFAKVEVNGDGAHPLYQYLKKVAPGFLGTTGIKWNFTKFLVSRDGKTITRFPPQSTPESLVEPIAAALKQG
jgi:glutathione peroxidase